MSISKCQKNDIQLKGAPMRNRTSNYPLGRDCYNPFNYRGEPIQCNRKGGVCPILQEDFYFYK